MSVKSRKNNVVQFRPNSEQRSVFDFTSGTDKIEKVGRYSYIGITLTEFLDFDVTVKIVAQSASRAHGLLIAKYNTMSGMLYDVFTKLYDSIVWPIISYGAAILGSKSFSCINAVQNRAMRYRQIYSDGINIWRDDTEAPTSKTMEMHLRSMGSLCEHGIGPSKQTHFEVG